MREHDDADSKHSTSNRSSLGSEEVERLEKEAMFLENGTGDASQVVCTFDNARLCLQLLRCGPRDLSIESGHAFALSDATNPSPGPSLPFTSLSNPKRPSVSILRRLTSRFGPVWRPRRRLRGVESLELQKVARTIGRLSPSAAIGSTPGGRVRRPFLAWRAPKGELLTLWRNFNLPLPRTFLRENAVSKFENSKSSRTNHHKIRVCFVSVGLRAAGLPASDKRSKGALCHRTQPAPSAGRRVAAGALDGGRLTPQFNERARSLLCGVGRTVSAASSLGAARRRQRRARTPVGRGWACCTRPLRTPLCARRDVCPGFDFP